MVNNNNMLSLLKTSTMAYKFNVDGYSIGEFHLGIVGTQWQVWKSDKMILLKAKDFDAAKKEAYKEICKYCAEHKLAPPPYTA